MKHGKHGAAAALLVGISGWGICGWGTCGCLSHHVEVDPIEIKPIHITVDVNLKVQRELDQFFDFENPGQGGAASRESKKD